MKVYQITQIIPELTKDLNIMQAFLTAFHHLGFLLIFVTIVATFLILHFHNLKISQNTGCLFPTTGC